MKPFQLLCLILTIGIINVIVADQGVQPVDAVLLIDGAPTYLRLTNSTSLETVYNCVLENSQSVNAVTMATQIRGVQMDVGQIEGNVKEIIRLLSAKAGSNGRTLWKSPEELKLFKMRLAHYLTTNYHDSKQDIEPDVLTNLKSQRSAEGYYYSRGHHRAAPSWYRKELREPQGIFPVPPVNVSASNLTTPAAGGLSKVMPSGSASLPPGILAPKLAIAHNATIAPPNHCNISTTGNFSSVHNTGQRMMLSNSSLLNSSSITNQSKPELAKPSHRGIHLLKWIYGVHSSPSPFSNYGYVKVEPAIYMSAIAEEDESSKVSVEGRFDMENSNFSSGYFPRSDENLERTAEMQSRIRSMKRFHLDRIDGTTMPSAERIVTDDPDQTEKFREEGSTEKPKKSKRKRKHKSRRQSTTTTYPIWH